MKKLLALLIVTSSLIASAFSIGISLGVRGNFGGNLGNPNKNAQGLILGYGFFGNVDFFNGFGLQAEVNLIDKTLKSGENSITISPNYYKVIDVPIMAWYNHHLGERIEVGGGAGINLSFYSYKEVKNRSNTVNVGAALGGNFKFNVFKNFGLVLGLNTVIDFLPTNKSTNSNGDVTYTFGEGCSRTAMNATIGGEFKLGF